jgi:hypothetical protein
VWKSAFGTPNGFQKGRDAPGVFPLPDPPNL